MSMNITINPEFEGEKRHVHSNRLCLPLMKKNITVLNNIFLTKCGYVPN